MAGPTEFTLESVRQYMLAQDGRVTNHELVKYFKAWLTHPTEKEAARQRFKEYVNTLATIRQENGEKFLVLKKRYYPNFDEDDVDRKQQSPSLLDEVMSGFQQQQQQHHMPQQPRRVLPATPTSRPSTTSPNDLGLPTGMSGFYQPPTQSQRSSYASHGRNSYYSTDSSASLMSADSIRAPPPYRPPPGSMRQLPPPPPPPNDLGLPVIPQNLSRNPISPYLPSANYNQQQSSLALNASDTGSSSIMGQSDGPPSLMLDYASRPVPHQPSQHHEREFLDAALPPPLPRRNNVDGPAVTNQSAMQQPLIPPKWPDSPPPLPSRGNSGPLAVPAQQCLNENKENTPEEPSGPDDKAISVKERTRTFNRLASEVDVANVNGTKRKPGSSSVHPSGSRKTSSSSSSAIKRRNSRAAERRASSQACDDKSDTSSINTIDQTLRNWMVKASQGDYHTMAKMLLEDPRLAKHRDFTSGFTALHWAAKHGDMNLVKLLAGNYNIDVNSKSHGGYTPLHLACQFGRQEVFDLLVKAYGADPRIRDNHGKTPRQYMMAQEQSMGLSLSNDTFRQLKDRRRIRRQASEKNPGILRFGSLSVKVKKTTEAFNNYFGSERKSSWSSGDTANANGSGSLSGPGSSRPVSLHLSDSQKMPPPKFAPIKKRKSSKRGGGGDVSRVKSAPTTPTEKDFNKSEESDAEYGFDANWT